MKKNIAITYGDPQGIGVEILQKIIHSDEFKSLTKDTTKEITREITKEINFVIYGNKSFFRDFSSLENLSFVDTQEFLDNSEQIDPGHHSFKCLESAIQDSRNGLIHGLVTGPISKYNWNKAGYKYKGQTELLGQSFGVNPEMLFQASKGSSKDYWRVMLLTRHIALKDVSASLDYKRLGEAVDTLRNFLIHKCKISNPKIALAGINPHAGENGEIGREEIDYLKDWALKLDLAGPFSPDEIWYRSSQNYLNNLPQAYDAYLAPYHDQVLPLIKTVTNLTAVNTTIGLPIPRTSPDHGTAFDLVGKNLANHLPFWEAIKACMDLL